MKYDAPLQTGITILLAQTGPIANAIDVLTRALPFIFNWFILAPVAIIVSGIMLSQLFKVDMPETVLRLRIPLPPILNVDAKGGVLASGLLSFFVTLIVILFLVGGTNAYTFVKREVGIDPGQLNSLCFLSAILSVVGTGSLFALVRLASSIRLRIDPNERVYQQRMRELSTQTGEQHERK